ncbi:TetR/AcrR family transcriptional regulator [Vibrio penaeicida]|uniref:TetR family transcriptional regulator n=1 Tax=Vibrio penaeicida TaxID=104609 RepID=A0AAV5NVK1_9VIBR|nr:TetR/AcrR family transcriptional regulator [Vibrio penaeicida]RTZ21669.1 TetR/AcrR family transcriptional regulator [Vibrio penaeicida]GLQ74369.1 TetR family transcriptional regulator [Vibrio penaeicida]
MSKKRQLLIDTALDLFYHQGIHEIGINEVLKVSGVAKRTLYSHFESKDALILAALEQRHSRFMQWLEVVLQKAESDQELIDDLFDGLAQWFNGNTKDLGKFRGCFFINTSAEFSNIESDILQYCTFHKREVKQLIESKLSDENSHLLDAICIMKEGAITTAYMTHQGTEVCAKSKNVLKALCS